MVTYFSSVTANQFRALLFSFQEPTSVHPDPAPWARSAFVSRAGTGRSATKRSLAEPSGNLGLGDTVDDRNPA